LRGRHRAHDFFLLYFLVVRCLISLNLSFVLMLFQLG
jgi:hypothetical protein